MPVGNACSSIGERDFALPSAKVQDKQFAVLSSQIFEEPCSESTNSLKILLAGDKGKNQLKIDFVEKSLRNEHCFKNAAVVHNDVRDAIEWIAARTPQQVIQEREATLQVLEATAAKCVSDGSCRRWLAGADAEVQRVSEHVNGPMLEALANHAGYHDVACVECFRKGADLFGKLQVSGNGTPHVFKEHASVDELRTSAFERNTSLLKTAREDKHSEALMAQTLADAALHRMGQPIPVAQVDLSAVNLAPRFGVEQGLKPDGSMKIRAVDDETINGSNSCCQPGEKLRMDGVDMLIAVLQMFVTIAQVLPHLTKADIDSAYRRVPLNPAHRWAASVVFMHRGVAMVAEHMAMPFGAVASVHAWDRVGALLCFIARKILHIPIMRFVDDFFAPELPECAQHSMMAFARLVRLLLGPTAISEHKLSCGMPLVILGLTIDINQYGVRCWPTLDKIAKWVLRIKQALDNKVLLAGQASKLAGALSWATAHIFHRLGRAMIMPIFAQMKKRHGRVGKVLEIALRWWLEVLQLQLVQTCPWAPPTSTPIQLFADARGSPPRLAAVLFIDGETFFTDWEPPPELMRLFEVRRDNQIMGLELLAIALGFSTFARQLGSRKVVVWSDNTGSEATSSKGTAKSWDHACIVHALWLKAAQLKAHLWIDRVPTDDNIADLPSRTEYELLYAHGAKFVDPCLDEIFWQPEAWSTLSARDHVR